MATFEQQALKILYENLPPGLSDQWEKKIFDLEQLVHISKALSSNLELNALIDNILNITLAQSQSMQTGVFISPDVDASDFQLHPKSIGFDFDHRHPPRIPQKSDFIRYLIANSPKNTGIAITELEKNLQAAHISAVAEIDMFKQLSEQLILFPLKGRGGNKIAGILILGPRPDGMSFMPADLAYLSDLASIAAIAIENARLYLLATTDMMTKLKIHHFFQTQLRECREESRESGRPLAMLLTDIDHFKPFNDTYGHQLGDLVLQEVARVVMENVGPADICARYGGEEFAVILPGKDLNGARKTAEKIRKAVEKLEVPNPTNIGARTLKVTISVGIGLFNPALDVENKTLIERCDQALYKAKHGGRNRVETIETEDKNHA